MPLSNEDHIEAVFNETELILKANPTWRWKKIIKEAIKLHNAEMKSKRGKRKNKTNIKNVKN
jgi:hypothetical protein